MFLFHFTELQIIWKNLDHYWRDYLLFPNTPRRPPPGRCINFDDSGLCNNLLMSPIQIIFDSDDTDISDDSGVIVIPSDEFEEENEDPSINDDADDWTVNFNNVIDRSPAPSSPPTPKRQRLL